MNDSSVQDQCFIIKLTKSFFCSCISKEKCLEGIRGEIDLDSIIVAAAERATCSDDSLTCCHDKNTVTDETKFCSDFADEGLL